jgi:hypothetical protein
MYGLETTNPSCKGYGTLTSTKLKDALQPDADALLDFAFRLKNDFGGEQVQHPATLFHRAFWSPERRVDPFIGIFKTRQILVRLGHFRRALTTACVGDSCLLPHCTTLSAKMLADS